MLVYSLTLSEDPDFLTHSAVSSPHSTLSNILFFFFKIIFGNHNEENMEKFFAGGKCFVSLHKFSQCMNYLVIRTWVFSVRLSIN